MAHYVHLLTRVIEIYVGLRTLRIWTRTGKLPELALGTSVLALAFLPPRGYRTLIENAARPAAG